MTRHIVNVQVEEGGGVPIYQYVELSNTLAGMPPGEYRVTIEPVDAAASAVRSREEILEHGDRILDEYGWKGLRDWLIHDPCMAHEPKPDLDVRVSERQRRLTI